MNHPVTSASNLFRRALCPGSERLEFGLPEEDSEQSREGQLLHNYAAHPEYDRSFLRPDQRDLLERNDTLLRVVTERIEKQLDGFQDVVLGYQREITFNNGLISGTADTVIRFSSPLFVGINDSKFGYKIVERADLNLQLRAYAVLVFDSLEGKPQKVFVSLTQPHLSYDERITLAMYTPDDIEAAREEIEGILKRSANDRAKLIAGEEQCRYCKAKLICPEFQKTMTAPVLALRPEQKLSVRAREVYLEQRLAECSDEQIEKLLVARAFAGMIKDPLITEARKRIEAGQLSSYHLSKAKVTRDIADPQKAISLLELGKIMSRDDLLAIVTLPIGKIEDAYREKTGATGKETRDTIERILSSVLEKSEQKPSVLRK